MIWLIWALSLACTLFTLYHVVRFVYSGVVAFKNKGKVFTALFLSAVALLALSIAFESYFTVMLSTLDVLLNLTNLLVYAETTPQKR